MRFKLMMAWAVPKRVLKSDIASVTFVVEI